MFLASAKTGYNINESMYAFTKELISYKVCTTNITEDSITLKIADDAPGTKFFISVKSDGVLIRQTETTQRENTFSGLLFDNDYTFQIKSDENENIEEKTVRTKKCKAPTGLRVAELGLKSITLSCDKYDNPDVFYQIKYKKPGGSWFKSDFFENPPFTFKNLEHNTEYTFKARVSAKDKERFSEYSNEKVFLTKEFPSTPVKRSKHFVF